LENPVNKLELKEFGKVIKHSDKEDWGIGNNWKNINLESAKFFLSQAEIMLRDLIADYHLTTKRAYSFLSIVSPIALFGLKLCYDYFKNDIVKDWGYYIGITIVCITIIIFSFLYSLIFPKSIRTIGSPPSKLVNEKFFEKKEDKYQTLGIYVSEITSYEQRIQTYISANANRGDKIRKVLILLVALAIFTLLFYLVGQV